jgi:hypothetical protein
MPSVRKIIRYMKHYGIKSTVGLIGEKLFVDPKRFSVDKKIHFYKCQSSSI